MFWRLELATLWRLTSVAKNTCLAKIGVVFKSFSIFPRTFVTVHLLSQLSPFQTVRAPIFQTPLLPLSAQKSSSNRYGFSVLNSILLVFVFFPLVCSYLFMILRWVCVSSVTLCPCLACENYRSSLSLILLLVLFFFMCLTRVCLLVTHLVWSYVLCCFIMFLLWMCGSLCWMCQFYSVHLLGASMSFAMLFMSHAILITFFVSLTYICL